ncbi:hypothetical protein GW891_04455, partial [bacterium]|nr:hypothetical protein [bacterium]
ISVLLFLSDSQSKFKISASKFISVFHSYIVDSSIKIIESISCKSFIKSNGAFHSIQSE